MIQLLNDPTQIEYMCLNPVKDVSLETPGGDKQKKREVKKKGRNEQINNIQQRKFMRRPEEDGLPDNGLTRSHSQLWSLKHHRSLCLQT